MNPSKSDDDRGDLGALLAMVRRRALLVTFAIVISAALAAVLSASQPDQYKSSSSLLFRPIYLDAQLSGLPLTIPGDAARDAETNARLVADGAVRERVAARLGHGETASSIGDHTTVASEGESNLVRITADANSAAQAKLIADTMANEFLAYRRSIVLDAINNAREGLKRQLAQEKDDEQVAGILRFDLKKLDLLENTGSHDVQVASYGALPRNPYAPKPVAAGIIGAFIGIVIGFALALIAEQLDRRVRRPEELERQLALPLLSAVPQSKVLRAGDGWRKGLPGAEAEAFRSLRANLRYAGGNGDEEMQSVLVTSAVAESGKTTVALHLAIAAAGAGARVLLLEADLRRPGLGKLLDLHSELGVSTALAGKDAPDLDAAGGFVTQWSHAIESNGNGNGKPQELRGSLRVVLSGPLPPNPSELLDSDQMRALLAKSREDFDLVVIDGPPAAVVSDAIPLAKQADGVILVTRLNRERRQDLERLQAQFKRLDIRVVGAVANFSRPTHSAYYTSVT